MVDPNIKKKADDIRNKIYGSEVRESLASGLEAMSSDVVENTGRQNEVEGQFQDILDETTNKDFNSVPEIRAARDGNPNLKARLDKEHNEVTAQLDQTEYLQNISKTSDIETVRIATFDGSNEPIHPSVVYFPEGWGITNTQYWMAYTPWPVSTKENRNDRYECPSIATSYNGRDWFTHIDIPDPLVDLTQEQIDNGDYYSDPSIVMNGDTMEVWFRLTNGANFSDTDIYRIMSKDGLNWSEPELVLAGLDPNSNISGTMRSQQLFYDGSTYKAIYGVLGGNGGEQYAEITDPAGGRWSNVKGITYENQPANFKPWHFGVHYTDGAYHMVAYDQDRQTLDYLISYNGYEFEYIGLVMSHDGRASIANYYRSLYQSYPIKIKKKWYLFVSGTLERGRSYSRRDLVIYVGDTLTNLKPVPTGGINRTFYYNDSPVLNNSTGPEATQDLVYATYKNTADELPTGYGMDFGVRHAPVWHHRNARRPIVNVFNNPSDAGGVPPHVGEIWRNNTTKKMWMAVGTSSGDWKEIKFVEDLVKNTQRTNVDIADTINVKDVYRAILKPGTGTQITYMTGLVDGQQLIVINTTGVSVRLKHQDAGAGTMKLRGKSDKVLLDGETASFVAIGLQWYEI